MTSIIEVTWHALDQFRERFPSESGSSGYLRLLIAGEIEDALNHNRYSTRQPSWARANGHRSRGRRNKHEIDRTLRFVWTEDKHRMYMIDKRGVITRVITSINPDGVDDGDSPN
jgi:hypothetical protein